MTVAKAGLRGFVTVMDGLEAAAKVLAKEVSSATTDTVRHKCVLSDMLPSPLAHLCSQPAIPRYGLEAGEFTDQSLTALGDAGEAVLNVRRLGYK